MPTLENKECLLKFARENHQLTYKENTSELPQISHQKPKVGKRGIIRSRVRVFEYQT
jgi:hypothetical protein